jgi:MFS family permease
VLVVMCVGYFLVLLDVTIVNVALPQIGRGLGASVSGLQWVVDGYALALATLMLAGGTIGDLRGHKRVVLTGLTVFGAGSLACGIAPGVGVLVAARVVQGVGAALLLPGTLAIISHACPDGPAQARAIGVWAGIGSLALPAGPLLGGVLIDGFDWRAIFLVNVPIVLVALVAAVRLVRESTGDGGRRLDGAGVGLGIVVLAAVTFACIEAGRAGVASVPVLVAVFVGIAALVAFIRVERARGEAAMLPLGLFRRPRFTVANAGAGTMNLCTLGTLFVLTLFLQSVQRRSPLEAGLALVPLFAPLACHRAARGPDRQPGRAAAANRGGLRDRGSRPGASRRIGGRVGLPAPSGRLPALGHRPWLRDSGGGRRRDRRRAQGPGRPGLGDQQHRAPGRRRHRHRGGRRRRGQPGAGRSVRLRRACGRARRRRAVPRRGRGRVRLAARLTN